MHRMCKKSIPLVGCLALAGSALLPRTAAAAAAAAAAPESTQRSLEASGGQQRLAVVVPAYRGDLERAVSSLGRWPSTCSPLTEQNVDLVLYYAEGEEDGAAVASAADTITKSAGRCFSETKTVFAHLEEEEDAYPKGPSVMFYKMFLDEGVRSELSDYDALAIVEWDVLVATENSFEELYHAAFRGNEDFWVKGSNLEGTNFHSSATVSEMWHVLGHINGNAIYNNNDPAFVEYVDYTRTRWDYTYPYDVALWLTISDFPYSWPLYQRFSNKFVTTNLIAYVGHDHVDHTTVSDAIAGKTLFIHGSSVDEGNIASIKATKSEKKLKTSEIKNSNKTVKTSRTRHRRQRKLQKWRDNQRWKTVAKWEGNSDNDTEPRWKREQKWAGNNDDTDDSNDSADLPKWQQEKKWETNVCDDGCESDDGDTGRVCDTSCEKGDPYGKLGCGALDSEYGNYCRVCYNDVEVARENDTEDDRAIMCDTLEPVVVYRRLNAADKESAPLVARKLQKWRDNQRWKTVAKWEGDSDNDTEPRWQREQKWAGNDDDTDDSNDSADLPKWQQEKKWETNVCDDGCESDDGNTGRVCDTSCEKGDPYGKLGCGALDSEYGNYCRVCYNDVEVARENDTEDDRAIMCDTLEPVVVYRRLNATDKESAPLVARKLQKWRENQRWKTVAKWEGDSDNDTEPRWKREQKWTGNNDDTDDSNDSADLPKWQRENKWESNVCDDGCESNDGDTGRVCDTSCEKGDPYGKLGCGALDSEYGNYCRVCYNDVEVARENDTEDDRAIMCDTLEPVEIYRRLQASDKESAPLVARKLQKWRENQRWKTVAKWEGDSDNDTEPRWKREQKWTGNNDDTDDSDDSADLPKWQQEKKWESNLCDDGCESDDGDTGRVCDTSCEKGDPYGKLGCGALDSEYGNYCRVCYNDVEVARENDTADDRAIMCDTLEPVEIYRRLNAVDKESAPRVARKLQKWRDNQRWKTVAKWEGDSDNDTEPRWKREQKWTGNNDDTDDSDDSADLPKWQQEKKWESNLCDDGCESDDGDTGRVCDTSCEKGDPYGKLGCGALDSEYGNYCRVCYNDVEVARENDTADDRAIMCDTLEPVEIYRRLNAADKESAPRVARKLQKWRDNQRWKTVAKWEGNSDNDTEPRWKREQKWAGNNDDTDDSNDSADLPKWQQEKKWETNVCDDGCESDDGDTGRVCDTSCEKGDPYGKLGCGALDSEYGNYCRVCYNDVEVARENDTEDDRAIMCDTLEPVVVYTRRLKTANTGVASAASVSGENAPAFFSEAAQRPYTDELVRDNLCAFISGRAAEVDQVEVTVMSILQFVPGMRVAIATEADDVDVFERTVGDLPGVTVSSSSNVLTASLYADEYCGSGTGLIFYVKAGSVVSRAFTAKDTHSPHGDLLVVYSKDRTIRDGRFAKETTILLGFEAPSFTHGTDLVLPVGANADLRKSLAIGSNKKDGQHALVYDKVLSNLKDLSEVPQMLAALQYSRNTPGIWFFNPQTWVTNNLFKTASIWEIPLVKPRFTCEIYPSASVENATVAGILQRNLDFFTMGGTCEDGLIMQQP